MNQRPQELHLEQRRRQVERAAGTELAELLQERLKLEPAMLGRVRRQPPERLGQLTLGADAPAAARLVPGDRHVHEPLEEVAFVLRRRAPGVLELLVRGEILAGADQLDARLKGGLELLRLQPERRTCAAGSRGRTRSGLCARRIATRARDT